MVRAFSLLDDNSSMQCLSFGQLGYGYTLDYGTDLKNDDRDIHGGKKASKHLHGTHTGRA